MRKLVSEFDIVIIDTAAGLGSSVLWFNKWAGKNIVIMTPDPTSLTDAYALIKVLATRHGRRDFKLLINSVKSDDEGEITFLNMESALGKFLQLSPMYLGSIPNDQAVSKAVREQRPFILTQPECNASIAIMNVAAKITEA